MAKPKILDCGCQLCEKCNASGGVFEYVANVREFVNCEACKGDPIVKMCPKHAKDEGWLK